MQAHINASVSICNSHQEAEAAIQTLKKFGFDVRKLSLIGKGYHSEEHPVGFYSTGDKIRAWGSTGAFWGSMWGILMAPAVFLLPPLGMVAMAGPIVSVVISALEGAVLVGGLSAVGAALSQMGVPKDQVILYETALKADKYVLMVHGSDDEVARAKSILAGTQPMEVAETLLN
ncbi:hypothetical protein MCEMSEM22_01628 [Comamonadaceae bacterium]|jgi:hypothetical protein